MEQRPTEPRPGRLSCAPVQPALDGPALSFTVRAPRARAAPTTCGTSSPSPRYPHWFSAARTETVRDGCATRRRRLHRRRAGRPDRHRTDGCTEDDDPPQRLTLRPDHPRFGAGRVDHRRLPRRPRPPQDHLQSTTPNHQAVAASNPAPPRRKITIYGWYWGRECQFSVSAPSRGRRCGYAAGGGSIRRTAGSSTSRTTRPCCRPPGRASTATSAPG